MLNNVFRLRGSIPLIELTFSVLIEPNGAYNVLTVSVLPVPLLKNKLFVIVWILDTVLNCAVAPVIDCVEIYVVLIDLPYALPKISVPVETSLTFTLAKFKFVNVALSAVNELTWAVYVDNVFV